MSATPPGLAEALAAGPEGLLARPGAEVIKRSRRTLVARLAPGGGIPAPGAVLKVYREGAWRRRLGFGRARRAARVAARLEAAGVPVTVPWACVEGPFGGAVVSPLAAGEGADRVCAGASGGLRRAAASALGRLCGALHRAGFRHRDLKAANLLVAVSGAGEAAGTLVDVDGVRRVLRLSLARRARDLARLGASLAPAGLRRSDCARFSRAYAAATGLSRDAARRVLLAVAARFPAAAPAVRA
ncbi:MAG: lipopolysaccharide kinase InaA family protein [Planctomycetales bacterium]|nr:lipopolysaccharide kinase InaA family protein [Planctomycetales bacterium]